MIGRERERLRTDNPKESRLLRFYSPGDQKETGCSLELKNVSRWRITFMFRELLHT